ncbi:MAG TPA: nuclear transport factor 2 family protein [Acidimicrobiia bacterium]|nr:nuclear transport factor 2 family protein [Acidimicrobiia bacterium]
MDRQRLESWVEDLRQAWESGDPGQAGSLFTEDAIYHSHPFRPPLEGREAIEAYWANATADQANLQVTMGRPLLDGNRAAVEWWTVMVERGTQTTDAGALILEFHGGRCSRLREYWNLLEGTVGPSPGWGS